MTAYVVNVVTTGGRNYFGAVAEDCAHTILSLLHAAYGKRLHVHHGACSVGSRQPGSTYCGADGVVDDICATLGIPCTPHPAEWDRHGRAAGPRRNGEMLRETVPTLVVAFPGGSGTEDCVRQARAMEINVLFVGR